MLRKLSAYRKNPKTILELHKCVFNDGLDESTLVWVCADKCIPDLKDANQICSALNEMGEDGHLLFDEDLANREVLIVCINFIELFSQKIYTLLQKLDLRDNTIIILSAEEESELLGKRITDFHIAFDDKDVHCVVVFCGNLYRNLSHSSYGVQRELLITIAHELGHAYTGEIYDEDGDLVEVEDNHGPDEDVVEKFGQTWTDFVLEGASDAQIEALILNFRSDITHLRVAVESGEIDPYAKQKKTKHF